MNENIIPCKQCIIQPICSECCSELFSFGSFIWGRMTEFTDHSIDHDVKTQAYYTIKYRQYLAYIRRINKRRYPTVYLDESKESSEYLFNITKEYEKLAE